MLCLFVFTSSFAVLVSVLDCLLRAKLAVLSSLSPPVWWSAAEVYLSLFFKFSYCLKFYAKKCCCNSSLPIWNCVSGTVLWCMSLLSSIFSFHLSARGDIFDFVLLTRLTLVCFSCAHHFRTNKCTSLVLFVFYRSL